MDVGMGIVRGLEAALAGLEEVREALHVADITAEALSALPVTRLPCGLLAVGLARRRGSWQTDVGPRVLWSLPVQVGVAVLLPAHGGQLERLAGWGRRLDALLEQASGWSALAAEVRRTGPPASLCRGLAGCVHQSLEISYMA
ncbi:MAG: hypothetical protein LDL27_11410 [Desulfovibrio sp.]|nr:hypothetical protein [Desulfovibrio sp.]